DPETPMIVSIDAPGRDDVRALLEEHLTDMRALCSAENARALDLDSLLQQDVTFWTVRENGVLLACGALRELDSSHGQIKSLRTSLEQRRRGAGRIMLAHLIGEARARRYERVSLEAGTAAEFDPALHLYDSAGFRPCAAFGPYEESDDSRFMTLRL